MHKIIPTKKQKLIYLQWQDAHSDSGWKTSEGLEKSVNEDKCIVEQVGWLVFEDSSEIHLIARRLYWKKDSDTSEYGMYQRIPKTWILKRKTINA